MRACLLGLLLNCILILTFLPVMTSPQDCAAAWATCAHTVARFAARQATEESALAAIDSAYAAVSALSEAPVADKLLFADRRGSHQVTGICLLDVRGPLSLSLRWCRSANILAGAVEAVQQLLAGVQPGESPLQRERLLGAANSMIPVLGQALHIQQEANAQWCRSRERCGNVGGLALQWAPQRLQELAGGPCLHGQATATRLFLRFAGRVLQLACDMLLYGAVEWLPPAALMQHLQAWCEAVAQLQVLSNAELGNIGRLRLAGALGPATAAHAWAFTYCCSLLGDVLWLQLEGPMIAGPAAMG